MRKLLLVLVAFLLLPACEMRAELVLREDGSGTMTYVLGVDKRLLAGGGTDPLAQMRENAAKAPFPIRVTDYETATVKGVRASFDFSGMADLRSKLASSGSGQSRTFVFDRLDVVRRDSGWRLTARAGDPLKSPNAGPVDVSELERELDVRFAATLPGDRGRNNATATFARDGATTYEWTIPAGKGDLDLLAETEITRFPWLLLGGSAAVLAAVAALLLIRRRRMTPRTRETETATATTTPLSP